MLKGTAAIDEKIKRLKEFQSNASKYAIDALVDNDNIVLDMNFGEQLYMEGVNRNNVPIMDYKPYAPATEVYKQAKGQPYDRVTLTDEGDFASGGELQRLSDTSAEILSNDEKSTWLQDKYGKEILGLKPDNMQEIREFYIKPALLAKLKEV